MLLIVETITWKPHLETGVEIALDRVAAGERVVYANLRNAIPLCEDASWAHAFIDLPTTRLKRAAKILKGCGAEVVIPSTNRGALNRAMATAKKMLEGKRSLDDVKKLQFDQFHDIGWGVVSSIITLLKQTDPSLLRNRVITTRLLASSILVYLQTLELIDRLGPDRVVLFNGRFATTRAVMRAAETRGVQWLIHERGGSKDRYRLAEYIPHDFDRFQDDVLRTWRDEHQAHGRQFFEDRRKRVERGWHSYTKNQAIGSLPNYFHDSKVVTFFTSSEDEMASIGDQFSEKFFDSQEAAIRAVAEVVSTMPGLKLCVRVHPHMALKDQRDRLYWDQLSMPGVEFIRATDKADSYAIIDNSYSICTFGSTVGIEATYWGTPSLLLSRSFYDRLGVAEIARSEEAIRRFLEHPILHPRQATLPFGAYLHSFGNEYRFYVADSLHSGKISGSSLDDSVSVKIGKLSKRCAHRLLEVLRLTR